MLALIILAIPTEAPAAAPTAWVDLFNGTDLVGWDYDGTPGGATVRDGAIRLQSTHPDRQAGHLFFIGPDPSKPQRFRNFELEAVCRAESNSNSGVFFHTTRKQKNRFSHLYDGYELQLNSVPEEKQKTGSLYAIAEVKESPIDETQWFTLRLRVDGNEIVATVQAEDGDAIEVVRYTEPDNAAKLRPKNRAGRLLRPEGGLIALQAHDSESVWEFRSIRVRILD